MSAPEMWKASVDSRSFSFEAYGTTPQEAREVLERGLEDHATRTGATREWLNDAAHDATLTEVRAGAFYRDNEEIAL